MNWNIFRRLDELETANLHLQVMLKSARADIETIKKHLVQAPALASKPAAKVKATTKADQTPDQKRISRNAYQRAYMQRKKAAAAKAVAA